MGEPVEPPSLDGSHGCGEGSAAAQMPPRRDQLDQGKQGEQGKLEYSSDGEDRANSIDTDQIRYKTPAAPASPSDPIRRPVPSPEAPMTPSSQPGDTDMEDIDFVHRADPATGRSTPLSTEDEAADAEPDLPRCSLDKWNQSNSWFRFPAEIRNMIYKLLLDFPSAAELFAAYYREDDAAYRARMLASGDTAFPPFRGLMTTPTILLLSRAIRRECRKALNERVFVLDRLPPWPPGALRPLPLTRFVSRATLQRSMRRLDLRLSFGEGGLGSGWAWVPVARDLFGILMESNSFDSLRVVVRLCHMKSVNVWKEEAEAYYDFMQLVSLLPPSRATPQSPSPVLSWWPTSSDAHPFLSRVVAREAAVAQSHHMVPRRGQSRALAGAGPQGVRGG